MTAIASRIAQHARLVEGTHQVVAMDFSFSPSKVHAMSTDCDGSDASTAEVTDCDCSSDFSTDAKTGNRVRFMVDDKDSIIEDVFTYEAVPHRSKRKVFLTHDQIALRKRAARAYCNLYSKIHPEYLDSINSLFESPLRRGAPTLNAAEAQAVIATSEARGMERHMNDLLMRHQRYAMKAVVSRFRELRNCEDFLEEEKDDMVRERSMELSRCTTRFALLLAEGDENEAYCIYSGRCEV